MATADATDAYAVVTVKFTPEQANFAARVIVDDLATVFQTAARNFDRVELEDAHEELSNAEVEIAMHRERLDELGWGKPTAPVTVEWQKFYAEKMAQRLLDDGTSRMSDVRMKGDVSATAYRAALREAEAGASILDQLEATS